MVSINRKKITQKISISIHDKNSQQIRNRKGLIQPDKGHLWKGYSLTTYLIAKKLHVLLLSSETKQSYTCTTSGGSSQCNEARKKIKGISVGKEDIKVSLFTDNMIIYIHNAKESAIKKKRY